MTLEEMVESSINAFDPAAHREAFRAMIRKVVIVTIAHLYTQGVLNDRKCHACVAQDLACPSCDADKFATSECNRCGTPLSCASCNEESGHG